MKSCGVDSDHLKKLKRRHRSLEGKKKSDLHERFLKKFSTPL